MRVEMFNVPAYKYSIHDWPARKIEIKNILKNYPLNHWTDYFIFNQGQETPYAEEIYKILTPVIQIFAKEMGADFKEIQLRHLWRQVYDRGQAMVNHTHGPIGYSACLYVDFDQAHHKPTLFTAPFLDFITGEDLQFTDLSTKEGDIVFFPSSIFHEAPVNTSNIDRTIIAMNFKFGYEYNAPLHDSFRQI
tara:strand:+ start:910 stop:1482 length:573 start_codon:yes stop_codon:yes gene_type:complete